MFGQGRPYNPTFVRRRIRFAITAGACLALALSLSAVSAAEWNFRVRLAWGGETRAWQGGMQIQGGEIRSATPLGMEPDSPGSILQIDKSQIRVLPRTPRSYESCDLQLRGDERGVLIVNLSGGEAPKAIEIPFAKLLKGLQSFPLDDRGSSRLLVQRAPGDMLQVELGDGPLVFAPKEKRSFRALANLADLPANTQLTWQSAVCQGRTDTEITSISREVKTDATGNLPPETFELETPATEGVYELRLSLNAKRTLPTITPSLTPTLVRSKSILERRVQIVVLAPEPPAVVAGQVWQTEMEIDPAASRWWERLTRMPSLKSLPSFASGPVGDVKPGSRPHAGRTWVELGPKNWQAYPLSVTKPGEPHILEIEYPSDLKQTLGVSLIEPNAAGVVGPNGLDSGFDVRDPSAGHVPKIERHRLIVWPQTRAPLVLLVNRRDDGPAIYGRVRLLSGPTGLEPLLPTEADGGGRALVAHFDKALLARAFSGDEALDPFMKKALDDWLTFYRGGKRMVDYLRHAGYSAAVVPALCEGSTLYPSELLQPTLRSDSGYYFETGQDPVRKDVLELLFRMYDRAGLQLIPSVQFASPLPELEAFRHAQPGEALGIEPLGPDGKSWIARFGTRQGQGSYYNPLDPRVREAMKEVVLEIADRYAGHPSFGGLALYVGPESYLVLPDDLAGCDDVTLERFFRETRTPQPPGGLRNPVEREDFLRGPGRNAWAAWRAKQITGFIDELQTELNRRRPGAKLILTCNDLLTDRETQRAVRPTLPADNLPDNLFQHHGLDLVALAKLRNVVLPRPHRHTLMPSAGMAPLLARWNQAVEIDRLFSPATAGHFHEPLPLRLASFDELSPFGRDKTHTYFEAQIQPAGATARERFVKNLANHDTRTIFDGGWMPVMGQEESLRPFLEVYRRLPAETFRTHEQADGRGGSPVIVRSLQRPDGLWFYAVNDSPWPTRVEIDFRGTPTARCEALGVSRTPTLQGGMNGLKYSIALEPYDLVGGKITGGQAALDTWRATPHDEVDAHLRDRIREAKLQANSLRTQTPLDKPRNPGFELPPVNGAIPGWVHVKGDGVLVETSDAQPNAGRWSLHLVSSPVAGRKAPIVWVRSEAMELPATGRLKLVASLRIADATKQPKLRISLEGKLEGRPTFYKFAGVGAPEKGVAGAVPLTTQWAKYKLALTDMPLNGLSGLRVGFDLMDEGEVWIDDVQIYDMPFEDSERDELLKMIATAELQLDNGRHADCLRFLESPWSVYLKRFANVDASRLVALPAPAAGKQPALPAEPPAVQESKNVFDRVRGLTPRWPFR